MSNIPRLYVTARLEAGELVPLSDGQIKYLTRVMRLPDGASVRAFNGRDGDWICALRGQGRAAALEPTKQAREHVASLDLTLMFAPLKKARTDFVVEKAAELGASVIMPIITEYTQSARVRVDRLQAVVIEAAEQTERMDVPVVHAAVALNQALADWNNHIPLYFCDEAGDAKPMAGVLKSQSRQTGGLLVGPEGGFSPAERQMLRSLEFVIPVTLGPRILRAETAVASALTLWQSEVGDWR